MKILFIGADNFWAEGVRHILEDMYAESVKLVSVQTACDYVSQNNIPFEKYSFVFIDIMSCVPTIYENLYSILNKEIEKIVFIQPLNSVSINVHSNLISKSIMISKHVAIETLKIKLMTPCAFEENNLTRSHYHQSNFRQSRAITNADELEVIRMMSSGDKIKDIAMRMNKSDKAIYHLISKIRLRMGFKSKHEFLFFLSTFKFYEN